MAPVPEPPVNQVSLPKMKKLSFVGCKDV